MKCLILYDSFFGNTEKVAQAMGAGLGKGHQVAVRRVQGLTGADLAGIELLIVGSPTRAFRPSPDTSAFIGGLKPDALKGVKVAGFDTRIEYTQVKNLFFRLLLTTIGRYAAPAIAKGLERHGGIRAAEPVGFIVMGTKGPLKEGELDRAGAWARAAANR